MREFRQASPPQQSGTIVFAMQSDREGRQARGIAVVLRNNRIQIERNDFPVVDDEPATDDRVLSPRRRAKNDGRHWVAQPTRVRDMVEIEG